ncbi:MAG TPA: TRAP transporter small permease [Desulfobacterales bacterium]|nr:TRAP transporter small permease [Desulfobacterales bacterium]
MVAKFLSALDRIVSWFEDWTLYLTVMAALLSLFANVVLRYGFNYTLAWSEELVREVLIYTTFIGCAASIKTRSLIKVDALVQLVPKLKTPLTYFSDFSVLMFALIMLVHGWKMMMLQVDSDQKTVILEIPLVYIYAILPLMGLIMILRLIILYHKDFIAMRSAAAVKSAS